MKVTYLINQGGNPGWQHEDVVHALKNDFEQWQRENPNAQVVCTSHSVSVAYPWRFLPWTRRLHGTMMITYRNVS